MHLPAALLLVTAALPAATLDFTQFPDNTQIRSTTGASLDLGDFTISTAAVNRIQYGQTTSQSTDLTVMSAVYAQNLGITGGGKYLNAFSSEFSLTKDNGSAFAFYGLQLGANGNASAPTSLIVQGLRDHAVVSETTVALGQSNRAVNLSLSWLNVDQVLVLPGQASATVSAMTRSYISNGTFWGQTWTETYVNGRTSSGSTGVAHGTYYDNPYSFAYLGTDGRAANSMYIADLRVGTAATPEASTWVLLALGSLGLLAFGRQRRFAA